MTSSEEDRKLVELIEQYGLTDGKHYSALRRSSMACRSLANLPVATMAEAERYLPLINDLRMIH